MSDMTSDVKQLKIETYNLVDFVMQIQKAVLDGYVVTDKSDEAPMCIGNCYHLIMSEREYQPMPVADLSLAVYADTTKLQETVALCLESVNHLNKSLDEQILADSLIVDEKLSTEEFSALANEAADLIDKVDNLLVKAEAKHIEATTPVKATPKQTRGKK